MAAASCPACSVSASFCSVLDSNATIRLSASPLSAVDRTGSCSGLGETGDFGCTGDDSFLDEAAASTFAVGMAIGGGACSRFLTACDASSSMPLIEHSSLQ